MSKPCTIEHCNNARFSKGLCQNHWRREYGKPIPRFKLTQTEDGKEARPFKVYRTAEIKKVSTRQQRLNTAYAAQRKVYLKAHPVCMVKISGCSGQATDVHHRKGRGEYLLDENTWLPTCRSCHQFIEVHPEWAKEKGFSLSRLAVEL